MNYIPMSMKTNQHLPSPEYTENGRYCKLTTPLQDFIIILLLTAITWAALLLTLILIP